MTQLVDIVNLGLQAIGTRTNVTASELANLTSNEAIQANIAINATRNRLLRMAPWDCAFNFYNLNFITSAPGTPENTSAATQLWQKGQPAPPWAYEYQYPVDCLRMCFILASSQTGFSSGVPITTAVTGGSPGYWQATPVKFKVAVDQFYPVTAAAVAAAGSGYAVGDYITLAQAAAGIAPLGCPAVLQVATLAGSGVATVNVVNQINGEATPQGGSYFAQQTSAQAQGSTTGAGSGATFNLTFGAQGDQRIILTNQEFAMAGYVKQVTDPNVMDDLFIDAWAQILGATVCMALTGDKGLANSAINLANLKIAEARKVDGNEGLAINDVTPDWIRARGVNWNEYYQGPWTNFDWGTYWPTY